MTGQPATGQPLTGQVVLVTGASTGFGRLTAEAFAAHGAIVFAGLREATTRNHGIARELSAAAQQAGRDLRVVDLDVTRDASTASAVAEIVAQAGRLDVVVNNAGVMAAGLDEAFAIEQWNAVLDVNLYGVQRMFRAALPTMRAQGAGLFVTVSSSMAQITLPFAGLYTASKRAVEGLVESYRYQLAPLGIDSVIVEPGGYPTALFAKMIGPADVARLDAYGPLAELPHRVFGGFAASLQGPDAPDPREVADAIVALASTPRGARPLRTSVDRFTREGLETLAAAAAGVQRAVFDGFGLSDLLGPKA
ncbi:MAG: SDR family NAD(P)-dependent oxidoreductase [Kofleriaceae bacterium]|nr:SDR family NAD(P)-dependent oxidoreductase [Kofleriaceae bacterium]MBP9167716.1 SDR family NAD(P)-dependent oxidoreductase [Kofleriaceae bacterium]MBP9857787.1 SDR family NAD(P)-dependent oxidoreductase [Kofleriaceae bacterium]